MTNVEGAEGSVWNSSGPNGQMSGAEGGVIVVNQCLSVPATVTVTATVTVCATAGECSTTTSRSFSPHGLSIGLLQCLPFNRS